MNVFVGILIVLLAPIGIIMTIMDKIKSNREDDEKVVRRWKTIYIFQKEIENVNLVQDRPALVCGVRT